MLGAAFLATRLPLRCGVALGAALGWFASWAVPVRRSVVRENLKMAFPEMTDRERRRLTGRIYANVGRMVAESLHIPRLDTVKRGLVSDQAGFERVERLISEHGGFVVFTGHLGSWELGGAHFARRGLPISAIAKPLHNGYLNDYIRRTREGAGLRIFFTSRDLRHEMIEGLRRGEIVTLLADQDARQFGVFVEFFGRPASTPRGPAMYALRAGKPILPVFIVRTRGIHHRILYGEPICPSSDPPDFDRAVQELTQASVRQLEEAVRAHPDQYFWLHRRWKTQPSMLKPKRHRRAGLADRT
jgi:KDO2-lipid IV(A) lauroyltransferase